MKGRDEEGSALVREQEVFQRAGKERDLHTARRKRALRRIGRVRTPYITERKCPLSTWGKKRV